ncbi:uncharacterized protein PFL1_00027 [Pseudozyma flocculosa PF-1]|uniref:CWH43-like N-terminal domain-containing protein n=1 Tax=Pseudozyma flocculosa TaxID=84751 RepID=A0A5C3ESH7_9BASI|nr:uncharacterized protein PFL1_00027 [Pseudozyma flocculosa PF-1]EPQ31828.1 hypothetical protein PFL1_00027 [Pseudozyma flocculosa PF-1]SPO35274.1 uncharacterized protein PSFLO_00745 [Pseudozyma flocculosa]
MKIGIHGLYWVLPLLTFCFWITNIVGLLGLWVRDKFKRYEVEEASIVFISDVGATHQAFFIVFSSLTALFYVLTTLAERHLRHQRRIPGSVRKRQTIYDILSVVFSFIGAAGLVLLSAFNAFDWSTVHWSMTVVFVVFTALSVLFQVLQVFSLSKDYEGLRTLKLIAIVKAILLTIAVAGAIGFIATYATCKGNAYPGDQRCDRVVSAAAVCEWSIAFILAFFYLTYVVDLWPAHRRAQKGLSEDGTMVENRQLAREQGTDVGRPTAPYAIDGVVNNDTHYPSAAAREVRGQQPHGAHGGSPAMTANTMPNSERGSLYQPAMVEAPQQPRY